MSSDLNLMFSKPNKIFIFTSNLANLIKKKMIIQKWSGNYVLVHMTDNASSQQDTLGFLKPSTALADTITGLG